MRSTHISSRVSFILFIFAVVVLTAFVVMYFREARVHYWILKDGVQGMARVTAQGGHDTIWYTYSVGGTTFPGRGPREEQGDPRQRQVGVGGHSIIWYSASHPWISTPRRPDAVLEALPWIITVVLIDLFFIVLVILTWPGGKLHWPAADQG